MDEIDNPDVRHEHSDVDANAILGFATGLVVGVVTVSLLVGLFFAYLSTRAAISTIPQYPLGADLARRLPPEPRLQAAPRQAMDDLRTEEDRTLRSYQWVDRTTGVVRIPIDEAIRLTLERGLPARASEEESQK
jgi:hypothetical protein